jgi:hypothetical protein
MVSQTLRRVVVAFALATSAATVGRGSAVALPPGDEAFGAFGVLPTDIGFVVRMRDGRGVRNAHPELAGVELALSETFGSRVLATNWDALVADAGLDGRELADRLLGSDVIYAERPGPQGIEWVLTLRMDDATRALLVDRLKPAGASGGRAAFPAHGVVAAWRQPYLIVGPIQRMRLAEETLAFFDAPDRRGTLAERPGAAIPSSGPAALEVAWAGREANGPLGACQVTFRPGGVSVSFRHPGATWPWRASAGPAPDHGLLEALAEGAIAAAVGNRWCGPLDPASPWDAVLGAGDLDGAMRGNLGARWAVRMQAEARAGEPVVPAPAIALEVRDLPLAERQWSAWAQRAARALAGRASMPVPSVEVDREDDGAPVRVIPLEAIAERAFDGHPFARGAALAWAGTSAHGRRWMVLATSARACRDLRRALEAPMGTAGAGPAAAHEEGTCDGQALAAMLGTWASHAGAFAPDGPRDFAEGTTLATRIAEGVRSIRWRLRAQSPGTAVGLEGTVDVELLP